jgi:hypothetical protein
MAIVGRSIRRRVATASVFAAVLTCLFAALPVRSAAQEPSLAEVLGRAAAYVTRFHTQLSGIVAEETYFQEARTSGQRPSGTAAGPRKTLKSDLLLVRPPKGDRYVEFRDVFEVNGTPVRDRDQRLTRLFLQPADASGDQIRAIVLESARHNIGDIPRNINTPMLTLLFLQPEYQPRFRFKRSRLGQPELGTGNAMPRGDAAMFRVTTEMWMIEYREVEKPTVIKTNQGRDFPATGRFWVNPESGAVLMSELVMDNSEVSAVIAVSYQSEPLLGFLVPAEMRERYRARSERVEGIATYGRFRQFQVKTDEDIAIPDPAAPKKPPGS